MKTTSQHFLSTSARLLSAAAVVVSLALAPTQVIAADQQAHEDRAELRIKQMHDKLMITTAEEAQWGLVAQAMRDNAVTMDTLTAARKSKGKGMTAVEDLRSYGEISEAHAEGIRKLTPVFADLYASMSDVQKKEADLLFSHGDRRHAHGKPGHMPVAAK